MLCYDVFQTAEQPPSVTSLTEQPSSVGLSGLGLTDSFMDRLSNVPAPTPPLPTASSQESEQDHDSDGSQEIIQ